MSRRRKPRHEPEVRWANTRALAEGTAKDGTLDAISSSDREWFRARPHRQYRVRAPFEREFPDLDGSCFILVTRLGPGVRTRRAYKLLPLLLPCSYFDPAGVEWRIADLRPGAPQGGCWDVAGDGSGPKHLAFGLRY
jgi:hypothetical protein